MRSGLHLPPRILAALLAFPVLAGCDDLPFESNGESDGDEIVQVSTAQFHACALTRDGRAFCWGDNAGGRLGTGSSDPELGPVRVHLSQDVRSLSAGGFGGCAVVRSELYCWGEFAERDDDRLGPVRIGQAHRWRHVSVGNIYGQPTCAIALDDRGFCWGGRNLLTDPDPMGEELRWRSIDVGTNQTCGVTTESRGYCWGSNSGGSLGIGVVDTDPTSAFRSTPHELAGDLRWRDVETSGDGACGLTLEGDVYCWGSGVPMPTYLPSGTPRHTPFPMAFSGSELAVGQDHVCAADALGGVACMGGNRWGQLGSGDFEPPLSASLVVTDLRFDLVDASARYSCGVTTAREVACWGFNGRLQLADGTAIDRPTPVPVVLP